MCAVIQHLAATGSAGATSLGDEDRQLLVWDCVFCMVMTAARSQLPCLYVPLCFCHWVQLQNVLTTQAGMSIRPASFNNVLTISLLHFKITV